MLFSYIIILEWSECSSCPFVHLFDTSFKIRFSTMYCHPKEQLLDSRPKCLLLKNIPSINLVTVDTLYQLLRTLQRPDACCNFEVVFGDKSTRFIHFRLLRRRCAAQLLTNNTIILSRDANFLSIHPALFLVSVKTVSVLNQQNFLCFLLF